MTAATIDTFHTIDVVGLLPRDRRLMQKVIGYARLSPDPSTQNAAVLTEGATSSLRYGVLFLGTPLVNTWAVNEFPEGVENTDERWERPLKYRIVAHAEFNAIHAAAANGIKTAGTTLVCPWAACEECAKSIIQAGIKRLVTLKPTSTAHGHWDDSISLAMTMLAEAGVEVVFIQGSLDCPFTIRRNGADVRF